MQQEKDLTRQATGDIAINLRWKELFVRFQAVLALVLLGVVLSVLTDRFLEISNLMNVARQASINAIIAAGATLVILSGEIDLSPGSVLALSGAISAGLVSSGLNPFLGILSGLGLGTVAGLVNGLLVTRFRIPSFIATLGMMTAARGLTLVYTGGRPVTVMDQTFAFAGDGYLGPIPMPIIIMAVVFVAGYVLLNYTLLGRYIYAVGSNEEATRLSGIDSSKIKLIAFAIAGLTAALSGIVVTGRIYSAQPTAGVGYELDAIAAVVLGGTSLSGGQGSIVGTLIGALIISVLSNGLNLLDVSSFYQQVVKGLVIVLAVLLDRWTKSGSLRYVGR